MHIILIIVSVILTLVGAVALFLPIPGAVLIFAIGLSSLIYTSSNASNFIHFIRKKSRRMNLFISWLEKRVGKRMGAILGRTRLDDQEPL